MRLSFLGWVHKKLHPVDRAFEISQTGSGHSEMRDDLALCDNGIPVADVGEGFKRHADDAVVESKIWGRVEIDYGRHCTPYQGEWGDLRSGQAFIGHDGNPWVWEASKECWLPITESSRADAYAKMRNVVPSV